MCDYTVQSRSSEVSSQRDMAYARQEQNRTAGQDAAAALDFASASLAASFAAALAGISASLRSSSAVSAPLSSHEVRGVGGGVSEGFLGHT